MYYIDLILKYLNKCQLDRKVIDGVNEPGIFIPFRPNNIYYNPDDGYVFSMLLLDNITKTGELKYSLRYRVSPKKVQEMLNNRWYTDREIGVGALKVGDMSRFAVRGKRGKKMIKEQNKKNYRKEKIDYDKLFGFESKPKNKT